MALKKTTRLVLLGAMLGVFMAIELAFGYISNSLALIADSFHMVGIGAGSAHSMSMQGKLMQAPRSFPTS